MIVGSFWYSIKKAVGAAGKALDEKANEHKEGYTALVRELKNAFRTDNYLLSVTVLPNVNTSCKLYNLYLFMVAVISSLMYIVYIN